MYKHEVNGFVMSKGTGPVAFLSGRKSVSTNDDGAGWVRVVVGGQASTPKMNLSQIQGLAQTGN